MINNHFIVTSIMNSNDLSSNKWQRMLTIVSQHPALLQHNLTRKYKLMSIRRLLSENMIAFLLQYTGLMMSTLATSYSPLWLASGTACGFIFLRGYSILPGIWLGSIFAYYFANMSLGFACTCATVYALQSGLLLWLSYRFITNSLIFYRKWTLVKFIIASGGLTALASLALTYLCYSTPTAQLWMRWWLANLNGILILSCALFTWDAYFPQIDALKKLNRFTACLTYVSLLILIFAFILSHSPQSVIWFAIGSLLLMFFISRHFGWCGTVNAVFLSGLLLTLAAFMDAPFIKNTSSLLILQLLLITETITGYLLSTPNYHERDQTPYLR